MMLANIIYWKFIRNIWCTKRILQLCYNHYLLNYYTAFKSCVDRIINYPLCVLFFRWEGNLRVSKFLLCLLEISYLP